MRGHVAGTCYRDTQQCDTAIVMLKACTVAGTLAERKSKGAYIFADVTPFGVWLVLFELMQHKFQHVPSCTGTLTLILLHAWKLHAKYHGIQNSISSK